MASAVFTLEDTQEVRAELSLLLQIAPKQLDKLSHNGLLTVEFTDLLEDQTLHVLSRAVSNHGFVASVEAVATKAKLEVDKLINTAKGKESATKGASK